MIATQRTCDLLRITYADSFEARRQQEGSPSKCKVSRSSINPRSRYSKEAISTSSPANIKSLRYQIPIGIIGTFALI